MNAKLFSTLTTVAIAVAGAVAMSGAFAVEATQYNPEPGTATRADIKAQIGTPRAAVVQYGEATVFVDQPASAGRALARSDEQDSGVKVVRLGEATEFIDQPGTRSRADVRAETLAAIRASRVSR
ncbi:MAG TPA: hypothetical protein VJ743_00770 [Albitalea sp.]|nr:hypothetical protein [Albitalea sp.]